MEGEKNVRFLNSNSLLCQQADALTCPKGYIFRFAFIHTVCLGTHSYLFFLCCLAVPSSAQIVPELSPPPLSKFSGHPHHHQTNPTLSDFRSSVAASWSGLHTANPQPIISAWRNTVNVFAYFWKDITALFLIIVMIQYSWTTRYFAL